MPDGSQFVRLDGLKRYFDVSAPWLVRTIEGRPRQIVQAVDGVDIRIAKGETFSLVGESGCGKSTVARLVVGLYPPTAGSIEFDGNDMTARRRSSGWGSCCVRWASAPAMPSAIRTSSRAGSASVFP